MTSSKFEPSLSLKSSSPDYITVFLVEPV